MEDRPNPVLAAMNHPQYRELMNRVFLALTIEGWPVGDSAKFSPWRHTPQEFIPPFAFQMRWDGAGTLSQEQEDWLHARQAFGHVRDLHYERTNGERFTERCLVVFDMTPQPKPAAMFHATPPAARRRLTHFARR